jgi:O-antigen/teichoic acid export membrane protein
LQLSQHIGKAAWSTADKALYVLIGLAFILPQKMIGESNWGIYLTAQTLLTAVFMLSDGLALQSMVTLGMDERRRPQAMALAATLHLLFIGACTLAVYLLRREIATFYGQPSLVGALELFPLVAGGFLLRNFFLKVAQLHIDTRAMFVIDAAWVGSLVVLVLIGWRQRLLATAEDMMVVSAISATASSLVGLLLGARRTRLSWRLDRPFVREVVSFGSAQFAAAATLVVQSQGDVLTLGRFASPAVVGNYGVAKIFFRGFEALRDAASMFVYPAAARLRAQGRLPEMVLMVEKMMGFTMIVVVPLVVLMWIAPIEAFFNFLYPSGYDQVPTLFRILSIAALAIPFALNLNILNGIGDARAGFRSTLASSASFFVVAFLFVPPLQGVGSALAVIASYVVLAIASTWSLRSHVPFSIASSFGRWRDALAYASRAWRR